MDSEQKAWQPIASNEPESSDATPTSELNNAYIIRHEEGWNRDLSNFHPTPAGAPAAARHGLDRVAAFDRPWGSIRQYSRNEACTTMLITISAGQSLNPHKHAKRAELWVMMDDGAEVTVDERVFQPAAGEEIWLDAGVPHRIRSLGSSVRFVEIAFGEWDQSDIVVLDAPGTA